jgi:hypothetical protein
MKEDKTEDAIQERKKEKDVSTAKSKMRMN